MANQAVMVTWSLLLTLWSTRVGILYDHLAVFAVKMQSKASAVIDKEQWTAVLGLMMYRTHVQLVPDAVFASHQFRSSYMSQLISLLDGLCSCILVNGRRKTV